MCLKQLLKHCVLPAFESLPVTSFIFTIPSLTCCVSSFNFIMIFLPPVFILFPQNVLSMAFSSCLHLPLQLHVSSFFFICSPHFLPNPHLSSLLLLPFMLFPVNFNLTELAFLLPFLLLSLPVSLSWHAASDSGRGGGSV